MKTNKRSLRNALAATLCLLWSAGCLFAFDSAVVFNEVQYHPVDEPAQSEWIEIKSNQGVDIDISGWSITGGVNFTFPANTVMTGNSLLVVATIPAQIPGALGPMTGTLSNSGETIRIRNRNGRIMDELSYSDSGDWSLAADGLGFTLARKNSAIAGPGPSAWGASQQPGGTPGVVNFLTAATDHDLVLAGTNWKFRDDAAAPPAGWETRAFDDSTWLSGAAPLGGATLTATAHLVERFRAGAITGLTDGQTVATWADLATGDGVAQDAVADTTTPTYRASSTPNGKPAVRFDGNDMARTSLSPGIASDAGWSVFMVVKANAAQQPASAYLLDRVAPSSPKMSLYAVNGFYSLMKRDDEGLGQSDLRSTTGISSTEWQLVTIRRNRSLSRFEIWVNGVMEAFEPDPGGALTPNPIVIGRHGINISEGFNGDIAEVLVYNDSLSDTDFQNAGSYLTEEYGLTTAFPSPQTALNAPVSQLRKTFTFSGNPANTTLRLNSTVADGAVFQLNGSELARFNMPAGPIDHTTAASSVIASPAASGFFAVPATALLNGTNVLAVSLHKANPASNSYFDAALTATEIPGNSPSLIFSEIASALDPGFFIELKNPAATAVSTSGWGLTTSLGQSISLPTVSVAPGGYVTFTATELGLTPAKDLRLALTSSNGAVFGDARTVTNSLRGLTASGLWGHPAAPTSGSANSFTVSNAIVINEIFYQGLGSSAEQWVELYNRSANPVDLSGWTFSEGISYTFLPGTILPAGGYLVVAWDPAAFATLHPGKTALGPFSGSLSGKGETLSLSDANENIVNSVRYGEGGLWSEWANGGGSSLELIDPEADNTKPGAWDASDESTQTAWQTVTYSGPATYSPSTLSLTFWNEFIFGMLAAGEVLIDDVSVTFNGTQLIQNGSFSGNSDFWRIVGNHSGTIVPDPFAPGNTVLKLSAASATDSLDNQANTTLKNGSSYHTLSTANTYTISFRAKWLRGSNRLHSRLYCNRLPRQTVLNVPATGGTPGAPNSVLTTNIGPTLSAFGHTPVVPATNAAATVTVAAADPDGVSSVQLFTSVNGAAFTSSVMTGSDGTYSGSIPGQAAGSIVQFYTRATDSLGAVSYFPPEGAASRALIQWADGRALTTLPSGAKPHNLRVIMTGADANNMYRLENLMSNADVPCTVVWDESIAYYRAGAQLKGSKHSRWQIVRVGYNLKFPADDLFLGVHSGIALDRSGTSNGAPGQEEILIKTLMNLAGGIYTPEEDLIRLIPAKATGSGYLYDGSGMLGASILSKTRLKDDFLDGQFENGADGMLFKYDTVYSLVKTIDPSTRVIDATRAYPENPKIADDYSPSSAVTLKNLGSDKENYRWHWIVENGRSEDNYADLINALTAIGQTGGSAAFNSQTAQYVDVNSWLRATVLPALFSVHDNYLGHDASTHNALIYFPPGGKAQLFPWDMDYLSQPNPTDATLTVGGNLPKFLANPVYKRLFWGHMLDILNRSFNTTTMTKWATHYSKFSSANMVPMVSNYLTPRAAYALTQINAAIPPVTFAVASPADNASISDSSATITGSGWIDVSEIRLVGSTEPLNLTWNSSTDFTLILPLSPGTRSYTLKAYNPQGIEVGSITRTYTNTTPVLPAVAGTIAVTELNFNPASSTDAEEFIELTNMSPNILDLSNCHFDETGQGGVAYTFPIGTELAVGGRIIVVRDRNAYQAAYGNLTHVAPNQWDAASALSNSGETLTLYAADGTLIFSFAYNDNLKAADGGGYTMVRVLAPTDPNLTTYLWRTSIAPGGNPGDTDAIIVSGDPLADADGDGQAAWVEAALGSSDNAGSSLPRGVIIDPGVNPGEFVVTSGVLPNADHVIATIESSPDLGDWTTIPSGSIVVGGKRFLRLKLVQR
jgi:Lamin Tail Domain/Concanavalin A-like lectin/glucanases superfamily/CotH kinase protein